ncbi:MFS general substrate transporter [Ceratobasidium sp. AG-I]|nr:MFS general substrate transporter [Ceratobasidium sp. AG-I]
MPPISNDARALIDPPKKENENREDDSRILHGKALALVLIAMMLAVFLVNQTVVSPALPVLASRFDALDKIAWVPSSYLLTQTTFLLLYGQALTVFDRKWTFVGSVALFEVRALILLRNHAPSMDFLIFGRAVAGIGASGIYVANTVIIADITTLEQRPKFLGLFGIVLVLASIVGPIMGGALTQYASWRWVFYINLPIGGFTLLIILLVVKPSPPDPLSPLRLAAIEARLDTLRLHGPWVRPAPGTFLHGFLSLDWIGTLFGLGVITMLLLPFQWGGTMYAWNSSVIIGLFVGFGVGAVVWMAWEYWLGYGALFPVRYMKNRSIVGASLCAFFTMMVLFVVTYYVPLQFQAVRGDSETNSGIRLLPYLIGTVLSAGIAGAIISRIGRYWHVMLIAPATMSIGLGLMYTYTPQSTNGPLIGYQIIASIGTGCLLQNPLVAIHANVDKDDVPQATAVMTFFQRLGGVLGVSIAGTIFSNELARNLLRYAPNVPTEVLRNSVAAIKSLPQDQREGVVIAYSKSIDSVYLLGVPAGALSILAVLFIRDVSIKGRVHGSENVPAVPADIELERPRESSTGGR